MTLPIKHETFSKIELNELEKLKKGDKEISMVLINQITSQIKDKYEKYIKAVDCLELNRSEITWIGLYDILWNTSNYFYLSEDLKYFSFKIILELLTSPHSKLIEQKNNIKYLKEQKENYIKK